MDVMTKQKEQLAKVEKQISEHVAKRRSTEGRVSAEHEQLRVLGSQRALWLSKLADASAEEAQKVDRKLDELESEMRSTERRAASLQSLLATIDSATAELGKERTKLSEAIVAEVNAKEFAAGRTRIEQKFAALHEVLVTARTLMGELNTDAASFGERFAGAGFGVVAPLFDEFLKVEHNQEQAGFRFVFGYRQDFRVVLNPMAPR